MEIYVHILLALSVCTACWRGDAATAPLVTALATRPLPAPAFAWPTTGRSVVAGYGPRRNAATGTVTMNPGIDIATMPGSTVTAAEAGRVSAVTRIPGYGTVLIIAHRDGYRTLYGKLARAAVKKGAVLRQGDAVGSVKGRALHFEVWRSTTRLNPITVLRR